MMNQMDNGLCNPRIKPNRRAELAQRFRAVWLKPADPLTLGVAIGRDGCGGARGGHIPAQRAASLHPMAVLREE